MRCTLPLSIQVSTYGFADNCDYLGFTNSSMYFVGTNLTKVKNSKVGSQSIIIVPTRPDCSPHIGCKFQLVFRNRVIRPRFVVQCTGRDRTNQNDDRDDELNDDDVMQQLASGVKGCSLKRWTGIHVTDMSQQKMKMRRVRVYGGPHSFVAS